jgi:hypothetical protein
VWFSSSARWGVWPGGGAQDQGRCVGRSAASCGAGGPRGTSGGAARRDGPCVGGAEPSGSGAARRPGAAGAPRCGAAHQGSRSGWAPGSAKGAAAATARGSGGGRAGGGDPARAGPGGRRLLRLDAGRPLPRARGAVRQDLPSVEHDAGAATARLLATKGAALPPKREAEAQEAFTKAALLTG